MSHWSDGLSRAEMLMLLEEAKAERLDYDRLQAAKRAALEDRIAALEVEVARLTLHHPKPDAEPKQ